MQTLAALMVSMLLLTTAFFAHALVATGERPPAQPVVVAGKADAHERQVVLMRRR
jgi:hypothetical protein